MLCSTHSHLLSYQVGEEGAIRILAEAGFEAFDLSMFSQVNDPAHPFGGDAYREAALNLRRVADEIGIVCNQAHAPFPSSTGDQEEDEKIFHSIVRAMEIAALVGAKVIVVHPKKHLPYPEQAEELKALNVTFYRRLVPYCERFGIKVAMENMFRTVPNEVRKQPSTCSTPEEFCAYIDEIGSPWIVACLDIGHAAVLGKDPVDFIRALGPDRLQALHVQDNDGVGDDHTLPFFGSIDYLAVMDALREIGYRGDLTLEAENFLKPVPQELRPAAEAFMYRTADFLRQRFQKD